jgi:hypothetical protein
VNLGGDHGARRTQKSRTAALKARQARADSRATEVSPIIAELRASGVTSTYGIAKALNERRIPTFTGRGLWQVTHIKRVLVRLGLLRRIKTKGTRDALRAALVETAHLTGREAADGLNARGITTLNGKLWNSATVVTWRIRFGIDGASADQRDTA